MPPIAHTRRPAAVVTRRGRRSDGGYVLAKFALLLVPLLLTTGLSVDVGYWYDQAGALQKAADAAALAGVVWLPDTALAAQHAKAAAARNGYVDGVADVDVDVATVSGQERRLVVTIEDQSVDSFFWEVFGGDEIDMRRRAMAEYVLPVPLGSPLNTFGGNGYSDPTTPAADRANLWGNIHGRGTDNNKGDAYSPRCRGADNCTSQTNPEHRSTGYLYAIDVPSGVTGLDVQVFDAGLYDRGADESVETGDRLYTGTGTTTTTWTFYDVDATTIDVADNPPAATTGLCSGTGPGSGTWTLAQGAATATYKGRWASLCQRAGVIPPGRYLLRVQTSGSGSAANRYALRVLSTSAAKARIAAYGDMSMYNNVAAGNATFYLAEVGPEHRGKTLELRLYDPGEVTKTATTTGNGDLQVISPAGTVASTCAATSTNNVLTGTLAPCQFRTANAGTARFNGQWITLKIPIPTTYSCTVGTIPGCWWKIKYIISGQGNDTTTWTANVVGDPVHLVEDEAP